MEISNQFIQTIFRFPETEIKSSEILHFLRFSKKMNSKRGEFSFSRSKDFMSWAD